MKYHLMTTKEKNCILNVASKREFPLFYEYCEKRKDSTEETLYVIFYGEEKERIVAVAGIEAITENRVYLSPLEVRSDLQKNGIGTYVLQKIKHMLNSAGKEILLSCEERLFPFYEKNGFSVYRKRSDCEEYYMIAKP